jgi:hypothetical protein
VEHSTGLEYGDHVRKMNNFDQFEEYLADTSDRAVKWVYGVSKHQERVQRGAAVMLEGLGPSPQSIVKLLLEEDKVHEAWVALSKKYGPEDKTLAIAELKLQMKDMTLKHPTKLQEYLSEFAVLVSALQDCNIFISDDELISIMQDAILKTDAGKSAYESAFTNTRQLKWKLGQLEDVLINESSNLNQRMGIDQLRAAEFNRELSKRQQSNARSVTDQRQFPGGGGGGGARPPQAIVNQGGDSELVKGTDGQVNANVKCYKCSKTGHYARACPTKKQQGGDSNANAGGDTNSKASAGDSDSVPLKSCSVKSSKSESKGGGASAQKGKATTTGFTVQVDDDWDVNGDETGTAYLADVELLDLYDKAEAGDKST